MGGGGRGGVVSTFRLSVKISLLSRLSVKSFDPCRLSVNLSLIFLSALVGNFFLVLSVVSNIFSPFVASRFILPKELHNTEKNT